MNKYHRVHVPGMSERATFGAGCFWGVQARFDELPGVIGTEVGYMGGVTENPTYQQVCSGRTMHIEVVDVEYDPDVISYERLLDAFWGMHDPTQQDRQGPDVGVQYRSVIFYRTEEQRAAASASWRRENSSGKHERPIATRIEPASTFWKAEEYHQKYLERNGGSCHI